MRDETQWIIQTIRDIRKFHPDLTIAILSRTNLDLFRIEEEMLNSGVPYRLRDCGKEEENEVVNDGVDLVTLHASKGLEWDIVFVLHCNDEVFPSSKKKEDVICERRLFYVAVTRARKHLFLTYNRNERDLSRFVREIPSRLLTYHGLARFCLSEAELVDGTPTLEHLIGMLDGDDYNTIRSQGLLSWLDMKNIVEVNLFPPGESWTLPLWAKKMDIARDFLRFLRTFIKRLIVQKHPTESIYRDPIAERLLFTLRIFSEDRDFWEKWRDELLTLIYTQFRGDEAAAEPPPFDYAMMADWSKAQKLQWSPQEILAATSLMAKIRGQLRPLRFEHYDLNEFTIGPSRYAVPTEMRGEILRSWRRVADTKEKSADILLDIWRISTLQLVSEGRNAPLYRVGRMKDNLADVELLNFLESLETYMETWIQTFDESQVGIEIESDYFQPESVDVFAQGTFWKIAGEEKERISSLRLLLLAVTAGFAQKQGIAVHSIGMLYPLEGRCVRVRLPVGWVNSVDLIMARAKKTAV